MRDEEYYEKRLHHWMYDSQVLLTIIQDSKDDVFKAGYWRGVEDVYEHDPAFQPCEQVSVDTKIDDDPGPINARRNPAGVWVPEDDGLKLVVSRSQSGKSQIAYLQDECTRYRKEIRDMMQAHKAEISELKRELELQREENNNLIHDFEGCKSSLARVTNQLEDCQKSRHGLFVKFRDTYKEASEYKSKYETANALHDAVADNYNNLSAKYHELEAKYAEIQDVVAERDRLKEENHELQTRLARAQSSASSSAEDNDAHRRQYYDQCALFTKLLAEYEHTVDVVESAFDSIYYENPLKSVRSYLEERRNEHGWLRYTEKLDDEDLDL